MQRNKATNTLCIQTDLFSSKMYDKRDDFDFDIVNIPYLEEDIPCSTSYSGYISQLIPFY